MKKLKEKILYRGGTGGTRARWEATACRARGRREALGSTGDCGLGVGGRRRRRRGAGATASAGFDDGDGGAETAAATAGSAMADSATSAAEAISWATATIVSRARLRASGSAKCRLGRRRGAVRYIYPHPFSPGWWLQPGLKTFGRRFPVSALARAL
jgi:hypothetical protein